MNAFDQKLTDAEEALQARHAACGADFKQKLNDLGYGKEGSDLKLALVHAPVNAELAIEKNILAKRDLMRTAGINAPITSIESFGFASERPLFEGQWS